MILVTGILGFIARHLAEALDEEFFGTNTSGETIEDLRSNAGRITAVFHLGAITDTMCDDWPALMANNVELTEQIAGFCHEHDVPLIFASSASIYGNGIGRDGSNPLNPYAMSKLSAERRLRHANLRCKWYALRLFNVYGSGEHHKGKQASVIWRMKHGGLSDIFNAFGARDWVHVSDVVKVMLWFREILPESGIYDVGTGAPRTFMDCANLVRGLDYKLVKMPESLRGRYQFGTRANLTKLRAAGYEERFLTLEEGVKFV